MLNRFHYKFLKNHCLKMTKYWLAFMVSGFLAIGISYQLNDLLLNGGEMITIGICLSLLGLYAMSLYMKQCLQTELKTMYMTAIIQDFYQITFKHGREVVGKKENETSEIQKVIKQSEVLATFYIQHTPSIFQSTFLMIVILIVLAPQQFFLTLGMIGSIVWLLVMMKMMKNKVEKWQTQYINEEGNYFDFCQSFLENRESIQLGGLYSWVKEKVRDKGLAVTHLGNRVTFYQGLETYATLFFRYLFMALYILYNQENWLLYISLIQLFFDTLLQGKDSLLALQTYYVAKDELEKKTTWTMSEGNVVLKDIYSLTCLDYQSKYAKAKPLTQNFRVDQVYCITGSNGIGKTTLFNTLLGFETEWSGHILINDQPLEELCLSQLWNRCLFVMDQESDLLEYIDVHAENIELSRGQRQQYLLNQLVTQSIHHSLILMDEPSASLDVKAKEKLVKKLNLLAQENIILVITHDQSLISPSFVEVKMQDV